MKVILFILAYFLVGNITVWVWRYLDPEGTRTLIRHADTRGDPPTVGLTIPFWPIAWVCFVIALFSGFSQRAEEEGFKRIARRADAARLRAQQDAENERLLAEVDKLL